MTHDEEKVIWRVVNEYAETVSTHGWNSAEANGVRDANSSDAEFMAYADAFDSLKQRLLGVNKLGAPVAN